MTTESFSVTFVSSAARIDPALWKSCFAPTIEGLWWYETLEQSGLEDQFSFLYALIHRDGMPVGIAPAFLMDFPASRVAPTNLRSVIRLLGRIFPSLVYPKTLFVGSPCADEGTVGLLDGVDRRGALLALHRAGLFPRDLYLNHVFVDARQPLASVRLMMSLTPCWLKPLKPSLRSRFSR